MANLVNIYAEAGADIIGDDAEPTLALKNTSSGPGARLFGVVSTSGASIADLDVVGSLATRPAAIVTQAVVGNQSIGVLKIVGNSVASGAAIEFSNKSFISITSVVLTTVANTDYAIAVQVGLETRYIPTFKAAALIGGAAFA